MSCDVGLAATALIRPLTWEPPYTLGAALEKIKKKKKESNCRGLGHWFYPWPGTVGYGIQCCWNCSICWIQSLAQEIPYALGVAIKNKTKPQMLAICWWECKLV